LSNITVINNNQLIVKEYEGQRIVTFKDIDTLHERPEGTAGRNFRENHYESDGETERFIKGIDYFYLTGGELSDYKQTTNFVGSNAKELILITESGYLMLVKSFTDDLAWKVQRELVSNYFRFKNQDSSMKIVTMLHAEIGELITETNNHSLRIENLENTMTIDYGQQLTLQEIANYKAVQAIGGKESPAYANKNLKSQVFSKVWRDFKDYFQVNSYKNTAKIDFEKAKKYLSEWQAQGKLLREIEDCNKQVSFDKEAV
jgi:hypothetical protein